MSAERSTKGETGENNFQLSIFNIFGRKIKTSFVLAECLKHKKITLNVEAKRKM